MRISPFHKESKQNLEARQGFYEGTYRLPPPYDEPVLHRVFAAGGRDEETFGKRSARILLSGGNLEILRAFLTYPVVIPLESVAAVFSCAAVGGRYVGEDCILKIVWKKKGRYLCTAVRLGPGQSSAHWKRTIEAEIAALSCEQARPSPNRAVGVV